MSASIITTLVLLGIVILFKVLEKKERFESKELLNRLTDTHSPSYSILVILLEPSTDVKTRLENLFVSSGYVIERSSNKTDSFGSWNEQIYFDTRQLKKGIIELTQSVVLNDPESVIVTDRELIKQLSKELNCKIFTGIWERISRTVMLDVYQSGKLISATAATEGKADNDNANPDIDLLAKADGDKLKVVLMKHGLNIDELFKKDDLPIVEFLLRNTE